MKLSHVIAQYFVKLGVTVIFGYQGGSITHMIDSFDKYGIRYIQSYNEQGAGLAADAYARISEIGLGIAIGTNGPGATNLITAIANAYCDSVPVLFLTGQVHSFAMKRSPDVRQESFQEIDIVSMVKPVTKYAVTITDKNTAIAEIDKAVHIALSGRKGPVLIDLPVDVQGMEIDCSLEQYFRGKESYQAENTPLNREEILKRLMMAEKPLILAGGGVRNAGATEVFRKFVRTLRIPVAVSLMGLDSLPHDDENFVGYIGGYGNRYANLAVQNADLILVMGSRLDMRQTGKRKDLFAASADIIHIDIDDAELGHFINREQKIKCDIKQFLTGALETINEKDELNIEEWRGTIAKWKKSYCDDREFSDQEDNNPNAILRAIGAAMPSDVAVIFDVGQNQMWAAQSLRVAGENVRILNSGGLGTMGYSLPGAIGAYYANPTAKVVALMGDGGLQMNIQELQMISQFQLPITVVVFNNHALGLIRDVHEKYYDCRYVGSVKGFSMPELQKIAAAYRMQYQKIESGEDLAKYSAIFKEEGPMLIEVEFLGNTYVRPELLGQDGLEHQIPYKEG